jgi:hypothetical protein
LTRVAETIRCHESAIKIKPVPNLRGLGRYLLKGMDPRYAARCGVKHIPQGLVYGKRCGVSKSLGPASRIGLRLGTTSRLTQSLRNGSPNVTEGLCHGFAGASQFNTAPGENRV